MNKHSSLFSLNASDTERNFNNIHTCFNSNLLSRSNVIKLHRKVNFWALLGYFTTHLVEFPKSIRGAIRVVTSSGPRYSAMSRLLSEKIFKLKFCVSMATSSPVTKKKVWQYWKNTKIKLLCLNDGAALPSNLLTYVLYSLMLSQLVTVGTGPQ